MSEQRNLPAKIEKMTPALLQQLSEIAIPKHFTGSNDAIYLRKVYLGYENTENAQVSYSDLNKKYRQHETPIPQTKESQTESENKELQVALQRNSLEEYRSRTGLDKLRDELKKRLLDNISFENGAEKIKEYIDLHPERKSTQNSDIAIRLLADNATEEMKKINTYNHHLTAEEVAWLSLVEIPNKGWIFDKLPNLYYPPALVDMDSDGLHFAQGTIDERLEQSEKSTHFYKSIGISGKSTQYELIPFSRNVNQIIKAIILLSINDEDLLNRIWKEQDIIPFQRGDALLLKSFIANRPNQFKFHEQKRLEEMLSDRDITHEQLDEVRKKVCDYFSQIKVENKNVEGVIDFVKLIGILSRVPNFVQEEQPFKGYAKLYGPKMDFISESGIVIDSVPLDEYLIQNTSYQFHDRMSDISSKNEVMKELMDEMKKKVGNAVAGTHLLAPDEVQLRILERYGIFIPTGVDSKKRKFDATEIMTRGYTETETVERSIKFGLDELLMIEHVLEFLPKGATKHVRSIFKEVSDANTLFSIQKGFLKAGHYDCTRKRIVISSPCESPIVVGDLDVGRIKKDLSVKSLKSLKIHEEHLDYHRAQYKHTLLHEIAESIYANLNQESINEWLKIESEIPKEKNLSKSFLTSYAKESVSEDFCETFAIYFTHPDEFRARAEKSPILEKKYDFMKKIWSSDGVEREFEEAETKIKIERLHGNPNSTLERIIFETRAKEIYFQQEDVDIFERERFSTNVASYDDLEKKLRKGEDEGKNMEDVAREHFEEEELRVEFDEKRQDNRITDFVISKTYLMLGSLSETINEAEITPLQTLLYYQQGEEVIKQLREFGVPEKKAKAVTKNLLKLYKYFEEHLGIMKVQSDMNEEAAKFLLDYVQGMKEWNEKNS